MPDARRTVAGQLADPAAVPGCRVRSDALRRQRCRGRGSMSAVLRIAYTAARRRGSEMQYASRDNVPCTGRLEF